MCSNPRSTRWLPPTGLTVAQLKRDLPVGAAPQLLDVRDLEAFRRSHLPGATPAPDSAPAQLVTLAQRHPRVLLICDDGRMSAMVARTLKFSGIADPLYLVGGLKAWAAEGGLLLETSETGQEHRIARESAGETTVRRLAPVGKALSSRVLFLGLAGAAAVLGVVLLAI